MHTVPTRPVDSFSARLVAAAAKRAFDVVFTSQTTYLLQVGTMPVSLSRAAIIAAACSCQFGCIWPCGWCSSVPKWLVRDRLLRWGTHLEPDPVPPSNLDLTMTSTPAGDARAGCCAPRDRSAACTVSAPGYIVRGQAAHHRGRLSRLRRHPYGPVGCGRRVLLCRVRLPSSGDHKQWKLCMTVREAREC